MLFFGCALCYPLIDTINFQKWKVLRWYTYRASFVDIGSVVLELNFQMSSQQQTVILGCFWVTFWPELPKMFSILFENLNSDDMQDDASDMPRLLLKYWEMVEIGLQTDILAHFESFFVYAFLHPMSYTPRFFQVKDIIKIYICGKFHQYSICGCGVKKFQSFSY